MAVTIDDIRIAAGLASLTQIQEEQATRWIVQVQMLIADRFGGVDHLDSVKVDYVVAEVVAARLKNPDAGVVSQEIAVDDARSVRRYETSSGRFDITDEMWALLAPVRRGRGAFTISPAYTPDYHHAW